MALVGLLNLGLLGIAAGDEAGFTGLERGEAITGVAVGLGEGAYFRVLRV